MLTHPTLQQLRAMKLDGMAQAFQEQLELGNTRDLSFEERLGLLVDRELSSRDNRGLERRLKNARLKQQATPEDLDYQHPRALDPKLVRSLASCGWLKDHHNLIITGPDRRRQNLPGLRFRTSSLPLGTHRSLQPDEPTAARTAHDQG